MTESSWNPPPQQPFEQQSYEPQFGQQAQPPHPYQPQPGVPWRPAGRARPSPLVLAAVAGLVLGGGGVGLAWWLTSGSEEGAAAYAAGACAIVEEHEADSTADAGGEADSSEGPLAESHRWTAAWGLAKSAADQDPSFKAIGDSFDDLNVFVSRAEFDTDEFRETVAEAKAACDDV